jgi:hypothetical protein
LAEHSKSAEELRKKQRKQRHKHITINPQQVCDLCEQSIFKKEFYVFPCLHAFHRECIQRHLKNYQTKDSRVQIQMKQLRKLFEQIESQKAKFALNIQGDNNRDQNLGSMNNQFDDSNKNSLISDIKNYFTK